MDSPVSVKSPEKTVRGSEERRFVQIGPDSISVSAETIGISNLPANAARALAEDASYRVREVTSLAALFLKHSKKRKLSVADMNLALKWSDVEQVMGHSGGEEVATSQLFAYVPENEIFVDRDREVDLVELSLMPTQQNIEQEVRLEVTANWLHVEGAPQSGAEPLNLTPALVQYYSALVTNVLGDSEPLCSTMLKDIRSNTKLSPLLPHLITFIRHGMNKYSNKPQLTIRMLRLLSALFSNPYLNLSPKPYLSHLVTALLRTILGQDPSSSVEHIPLAASILSLALSRWATPVNQLKCQTLKHLTEFVTQERGPVPALAQYGAMTSLTLLGPEVLCESLTPWPRVLWDQLERMSSKPQDGINCLLWAAIRKAGAIVINYWIKQNRDDVCWALYEELYSFFGPSIVPEVNLIAPGYCLDKAGNSARMSKISDSNGKMRLSKVKVISRNKTESRSDDIGKNRNNLEPILTASQNFDYLADMGVPSDIFEPVSDLDRRESVMDMNLESHYKHSTPGHSLSYRVMEMFPQTKAVKPRPHSIMIQLTGCRPWSQDRLRQVKLGSSLGRGISKQSVVPWRQVVTGGRIGAFYRRRDFGRIERIPNYIDVLLS